MSSGASGNSAGGSVAAAAGGGAAGGAGAANGGVTDLENLHNCLALIRELRSSSSHLWRTASDGLSERHAQGGDEPGKQKRFLAELKAQLDGVTGQISQLEQNLSQQTAPTHPLPLGHSVYLSLDAPPADLSPLYQNLVDSFKWVDKAHGYTSIGAALLAHNNLSRSYGKVTKNRRRPNNTSHTAAPGVVDNMITQIGRLYGDMSFSISRPNNTRLHLLVEVSLERILKAVLIFKGLMIEWVVVRGFDEESSRPAGQPDVWTESKYQVFRRITENANAAMLNFQSPVYPDLAVKSFMTYLHSFVNLFTDKCKKCGYHLYDNVPPTWREYKTLEPYHEDCKP